MCYLNRSFHKKDRFLPDIQRKPKQKMSAILQTWNRMLVDKLMRPNHRICARYYSALMKCHHRNDCVLLSQIVKNPNFSVQPCDKRDFIGWVRDRKDGYRTQKEESETAHLKFGVKQLKNELKIWKEEVKEQFRYDPMMFVPPGKFVIVIFCCIKSIILSCLSILGEIDTVFEFGKQEDLDKFVVTADSDHNEGYSHCTFKLNQSGYGHFSGVLDSTVPKQGQISKAGYCNITSLRAMKSFQRESYYDWHPYNTLVIRVRGDGRPYAINLHSDGLFDVTWHDIYTYVLYTRGGPHWQLTKVTFESYLHCFSNAPILI